MLFTRDSYPSIKTPRKEPHMHIKTQFKSYLENQAYGIHTDRLSDLLYIGKYSRPLCKCLIQATGPWRYNLFQKVLKVFRAEKDWTEF